MNKIFFLLVAGVFGVFFSIKSDVAAEESHQTQNTCPESAIKIDGIACLVISDEGIVPVYYSDIWLPSALGVQTSLEERIIRMIWIARGADRGVKINNDGSFQEYAEDYLDMLQQQRGVTRDDLRKMCQEAGFTMNDIKRELNQQFLLQQSVETLLMTSGCLNVPAEEIEMYYNENPEFIPAEYTYRTWPADKSSEPVVHMQQENNLSEDIAALLPCMNIGECKTYEKEGIMYCIQLDKKRPEALISLSNRYETILRNLQQKKYRSGYIALTVNFLQDDENVFFMDPELKNKCIDFIKQQEGELI